MGNRRQPSEAFFRRVQSYSEPAKKLISRIRRYKESDAWLWTEVAAVVVGLAFVIPTAIALWIDLDDRKMQREAIRIDLEDRQTQRITQAWQLLTQPAPGNSPPCQPSPIQSLIGITSIWGNAGCFRA